MSDVIWALVPILFVFFIFGGPEMLGRYFKHRERMAKIRHGINPDPPTAPSPNSKPSEN